MKVDKEWEKQLTGAIRKAAKTRKLRVRSYAIYTVENDAFISCCFFIEQKKFSYRIKIKNYDYDDIFWKIMQMPENSNEPDSLRAVGAFAAPQIILAEGEIERIEDCEEQANNLIDLMMETSHNFLKNNNIDEYVLSCTHGYNLNILKYLAYIHMNKNDEAKRFAEEAVRNGDLGNFVSAGKYFFEWALLN